MPGFVRVRTLLASAALLSMSALPALAQATGTVEGTVIGAGNKRPIAGAQVSIVGSGARVGAITDQAGFFRILNVTSGQRTVRARLLGYTPLEKTGEVTPNGSVTINFELQATAIELNAIVTTGTGGSQVETRKLGNTVATIEALPNAPVRSFSDLLQGREAGVMSLPSTGTTGEGSRIRIRGNASLSQSNEPIVYVDGVRIDNGGGFGSGFVGTGGGGRPSRLDDIDPTVIERVEILKGAAAATLYGTEASNGVMLITTKKGVAGSPRWTIEVDQSMKAYPQGRIEEQWGVPFNSLTAAGARRCAAGAQACADSQATRLGQHYGMTLSAYQPFKRDVATKLFETGRTTTVGAQVTGGTPLVNYFGSVRGYSEDGPFTAKNFDWKDSQGAQRGVFMKDLLSRYAGTLSLGLSPTSTFKIQSTTLYTQTKNEIPENNNSIYSPYTVALFSKPENAQCDASVSAGLAVANGGSMQNGLCAGPGNPTGASSFGSMRELLQPALKQDARHFNGSVRASYIPTAELNLDATFGVDFTAQRSAFFLPFGNNVDQRINRANGGSASVDDRTHQEITLSVNGAWNRTLPSKFTSNLLFGAQGFLSRDNDESSNNQGFPGPGIEVVGGGSSPQVFESFSSIVNAGYFAQEQVGYNDWLFATVGARYDYNSAFGKKSEGVVYPQANISVIPSDRASWSGSFMSNYLSTLRFRAAIGKAGRQPGAFDKLTTYRALTSTTGAGLVPSNLGNPDLRPEVATEWEVGTEFGVLSDRLSVGFTRWDRTIKDALYARQFPVTGGFRASQLDNIGKLEAWGWDAHSKLLAVDRPNVSLDINASLGFLKQNVASLGGAPPSKVGGSYPRYRNFVIEGYAPGSFFGGALPGACPAGTTADAQGRGYLPKQPTSPATATTGGICLMPGQTAFDTDANGVPDTDAQVLAYLANPRLVANLNHIAADNDNDKDFLDHFDGKPLPDFEGAVGASATLYRNWRVGTNFEYRFGNYTISDLTGAFRRANPTNGGNTEERAKVEGILADPTSTAQERYDVAKQFLSTLKGLSPFDGLNQQFDGDFLRWRELSITYIAPRRWAALAGGSDLELTFSARNFMMWTKYPGVDPEVNVFSRRSGGGTDTNFGESIDAFGFPLPRQFGLNIRLGF